MRRAPLLYTGLFDSELSIYNVDTLLIKIQMYTAETDIKQDVAHQSATPTSDSETLTPKVPLSAFLYYELEVSRP